MGYFDGGVHIGGRAQAGARNGLLRGGIDHPPGCAGWPEPPIDR